MGVTRMCRDPLKSRSRDVLCCFFVVVVHYKCIPLVVIVYIKIEDVV